MLTSAISILVAFIISIFLLLIPQRKDALKSFIFLATITILSILVITDASRPDSFKWLERVDLTGFSGYLKSNQLLAAADSTTIIFLVIPGLFLPFLTALALYFGKKHITGKHHQFWIMLSVATSFLMIMSADLYFILFFWGISSIPLYLLITGYSTMNAREAKKTLIFHGGTHGIMITGVVAAVYASGTSDWQLMQLEMNSRLNTLAFYMILCGGLVKMGIFPFHSWVPGYCKEAPAGVSTLLPLFLEKLVGAFLIIRIVNDIFIVTDVHRMILILLAAFTMLHAAIMGLAQINLPKATGHLSVFSSGFILLCIAFQPEKAAMLTAILLLTHSAGLTAMLLKGFILWSSSGNKDTERAVSLFSGQKLSVFIRLLILFSLSGIPPLGSFIALTILTEPALDAFIAFSWDGRTGLAMIFVLVIGCKAMIFSQLLLLNQKLPDQIYKDSPEATKHSGSRIAVFVITVQAAIVVLTSFTFLFPGLLGFDNASGFAQSTWRLSSQSLGVSMLLAAAIVTLGSLSYHLLNRKGEQWYAIIKNTEKKGFTDTYEILGGLVFAIYRPLSRAHDGILPTYLIWVLGAMIILFLLI